MDGLWSCAGGDGRDMATTLRMQMQRHRTARSIMRITLCCPTMTGLTQRMRMWYGLPACHNYEAWL